MEAEEFARASEADSASERHIADRLDALEAERVFRRALQLEAQANEQPHLFTADQLENIAGEIGIDLAFVRQAIGEVRLSPAERSRIERWILPEQIMEVETIEGLARPDVDDLIETWMKDSEGLIERRRLADGVVWDVDRRIAARIRATITSGGNRISRAAGGDVSHRVQSVGSDEHVIAFQSRGHAPLAFAKTVLGLAATVLVVGTILALGSSRAGFTQIVTGLLVGSAAIAAGGIFGARSWANRIRRALRRSLTNMMPRSKSRSSPSRRLPWLRR